MLNMFMFKKISLILATVGALFFSAHLALAQYGLQDTAKRAQYQEGDIYSTIGTVISMVLVTIGIVFLVALIVRFLKNFGFL